MNDTALGTFMADLTARLAAKRERRILDLVGLEFRQTVTVRVRKPRWMPTRLYRWLMRTIVIEEGPVIFGQRKLDIDLPPPRLDGYLF